MSNQRWLVHAGSTQSITDARLRLYCLPHAGAGVSAFRSWFLSPQSTIDYALVRLPARESRLKEPPFTDLSLLVDALVDDVAADLSVPYAVFGHCLGALVGFELVRRLRRKGAPQPTALLVSNSCSPHMHHVAQPLSHLPLDAFVHELRSRGSVHESLLEDHDMRDIIVRVLRGDFAMAESYIYRQEAPLDCSIVAFASDEFAADESDEDVASWRIHTTSSFRVIELPAKSSILDTGGAATVLEVLAGPAEERQ